MHRWWCWPLPLLSASPSSKHILCRFHKSHHRSRIMDLTLFRRTRPGRPFLWNSRFYQSQEFTYSAVPTMALASFHITFNFNIASDYTSNRLELRLSTEPTRRGRTRTRAILARRRVHPRVEARQNHLRQSFYPRGNRHSTFARFHYPSRRLKRRGP